MFNKILVPVDGSEHSLKAARMAAEIARRFEAQLTLCNAAYLPESMLAAPNLTGVVTAQDALEEAATQILQMTRKEIDLPDEQIREVMLRGHPAEVILDYNKAEHFDLIVMGSRGRSGVKAFLLGSTSDKVSHHATCPVLIVH